MLKDRPQRSIFRPMFASIYSIMTIITVGKAMICRCHLGFSGNAIGVDMVFSCFPFSQWEQHRQKHYRYDSDVWDLVLYLLTYYWWMIVVRLPLLKIYLEYKQYFFSAGLNSEVLQNLCGVKDNFSAIYFFQRAGRQIRLSAHSTESSLMGLSGPRLGRTLKLLHRKSG